MKLFDYLNRKKWTVICEFKDYIVLSRGDERILYRKKDGKTALRYNINDHKKREVKNGKERKKRMEKESTLCATPHTKPLSWGGE